MKIKILLLPLILFASGCTTTSSTSGKNERPHILQIASASFPKTYSGDMKTKEVIVEIAVDENGMITDAFIHSPPDPQLNEVAIEAAKRFKISPMITNGERVPTKMRVPVKVMK